jgi:gliding motility-associated-like protein
LYFYILIPSCIRAAEINSAAFSNKVNSATFEENLGQIKYPDNKPAPEVKFVIKQGNLKIFLLKNGLAYQLEKYLTPTLSKGEGEDESLFSNNTLHNTTPKRLETYRMDMELIGANPNPEILAEGKSDDYTNYYQSNLIQTHNYQKIIYKNIYPGIDWVLYTVNSSSSHISPRSSLFKYDFIIHPGADPNQIKLKYKNTEQIYLDSFGNIILRNRLGDIREDAPEVFQHQEILKAHYILTDSIVCFHIKSYDPTHTLIIDPKLEWSTYFGGTDIEQCFGSVLDNTANIYTYGFTNSSSNIAYNGYQDTLINVNNAYLAKFNTKGQLIWSTYYGSQTFFRGACVDSKNNISLVGYVISSSTNISFNGHQNSHNGGTNDGLLVKFNAQGQRLWASYYGGMAADNIWDCAIDSTNSIIIYGQTTSQSNIASNGHQNTIYLKMQSNGTYPPNSFLVKFNENGVRLWGSYFGINGSNYSKIALDYSNNIFISGGSNDDKLILNANTTIFGAFHFLAKFSPSGSFIFSKRIGLNSVFAGLDNHLCFNKNKLYFSIAPTSMINPPNLTSGFKKAVTGPNDVLFVQLDTLGNQLWASYVGGNDRERAPRIVIDKHQNRYIAAHTISPSGIYVKGVDSSLSGGNDLFVTKISKSDSVIWSSYFGGDNMENDPYILVDSNDNIYLSATTLSINGINYQGHQNNYGGGLSDAFLMKISCSRYDTIRDTICFGDSVTYRSKKYSKAGFYTDSFLTWDICDSFITLHLTVLRRDTIYRYDTICSGTNYVWNGTYRTMSGIYRDTLTNNVGCDSFLVLNLHIKRTDTIHLYDTSCANLPKTFNGQNLTLAGIYRDTLINNVGCDSHIFYHFIPKPVHETPLSRAICANDSSLFGGKYRKTAGVYYDTLKTIRNCDSVLKLTLTINLLDTNRQTQAICRGKSYNFYSQVLTSAGTYSHKLTNRNGCDSTVLLTLSVIDSSTYSYSRMLCSGQSFSFNNQNLTQAGVYRDTFMNYLGCDSFVTLNLSFGLVLYDTLRQTVCAGQVFRGYFSPGTYYETYKSNQGCDSILTIYLKHLPATEYKTIQHSKCGAFRYGSSTYTQNDSFTETIKNSLNCDSIVTKHLVTITKPNPMVLEPKSIPFCEEILHRNQAKTQSFYTQDTVKSAEYPYCDSLYQPIFYQREIRPDLAIYAASDTVIRGQTIQLSAALANNYRWNTGEQTTVIRPRIEESNIFTVRGWNLDNCESQASISITAIEPLIIDFPTAFSPNGDGLNDSFFPNTNQTIIIESFDIYNRIGEKVYSYTPQSPSWNGFYLGQSAAAGVYSYILNYRFLANRFTKTGEVMVVR